MDIKEPIDLEKELTKIEKDNMEDWDVDESIEQPTKGNKIKKIISNVTDVTFIKILNKLRKKENKYAFEVIMWIIFYCLQLSFKITLREIKEAIFRVYHKIKDQKAFNEKMEKRMEKLKEKYKID